MSIVAIQAPAIKPLFNRSRWLGSSNENGGSTGYGGKGFRKFGMPSGSQTLASRQQNGTFTSKSGNDLEVGNWKQDGTGSDVELKDLSRNGSQDSIIENGDKHKTTATKGPALEIQVTQMYGMGNSTTSKPENTQENIVETEDTMPFRTEQWGMNTEISAGNQQKAAKAKASGKAAKLMGLNPRAPSPF